MDHIVGSTMQPHQRTDLPVHPHAHLFDTALGPYLFVTDRSRIYALPTRAVRAIERALAIPSDDGAAHTLIAALTGIEDLRDMSLTPVAPPPLRSLSLNIAQACNMGCRYCYADEGRFGGAASRMSLD